MSNHPRTGAPTEPHHPLQNIFPGGHDPAAKDVAEMEGIIGNAQTISNTPAPGAAGSVLPDLVDSHENPDA
jgi:hypothetical protein